MKKLLLLLFFPFYAFGQNTIGLPDVINYPKQAYSAGLQNWEIKQDKNGIIYVANNEGLMTFDGTTWRLYPLPNRTIVRSVEIGADNRVYVGGQDELGFFAPSANGVLQFYSLVPQIAKQHQSFGDVWDIVSIGNAMYFRSANKVFQLKENKFTVLPPPVEWSFMAESAGQLYAQDVTKGLLRLQNGQWTAVSKSTLPAGATITSMLSLGNDSVLITTLKAGLFVLAQNEITRLSTPNNPFFENERIYAACKTSNNRLALATSNSGIYITDLKGNIIQSFSVEEGLQNNNVLSIGSDRQGNLWLGLDNGIDLITYNSAIKEIIPGAQAASGYTAIIHNRRLYMGTSTGLFSVALQPVPDLSFSKGIFEPVTNTKGQTWGIAQINNQILLGHHEGAFSIQNNKALPFSAISGVWNFNATQVGRMVAGHYKGLSFFDINNGAIKYAGGVPGFEESCRFVAIDENENIWVSHPYHGVFKISRNPAGQYIIQSYTQKKGLPSALNNHVYKVQNEVLVATENGVYQYDAAKDVFVPSAFYRKFLGTQSIRYLKADSSGNIWFIHDKTLGVIDQPTGKPQVFYLPELNNKMLSGFEFIYPVDAQNIFLGAEKGFFHINYEKYKHTSTALQVQVRLVKITAEKDSTLFGGFFKQVNEAQLQNENSVPKLAYTWKTIRFEFSSALYGYQSNISYSYKLQGFDKNWSEWTRRTEKEYTNLPPGKYVFEVKARNNLGKESAIAVYGFAIMAPWYQTWWAAVIYLILLAVALYALYKWLKKKFRLQRQRYEEEQKRLLYIHELERSKAENELVALGNEKLEAEINFKNSELASAAMHLVKKGEMIAKIKGEIAQVMKGLDNAQATMELKRMIKTLSDDDNMDKEWENFSKHFDKVQSDFLVVLKE
ncbi:MAG: transcriptional regulator, partial [Chitinophagaceae bacterium]